MRVEWIRIAAVCVAAIAAGLAIWGYKVAKQAEEAAREAAEAAGRAAEAFRQLGEMLDEFARHLEAYSQCLAEEFVAEFGKNYLE